MAKRKQQTKKQRKHRKWLFYGALSTIGLVGVTSLASATAQINDFNSNAWSQFVQKTEMNAKEYQFLTALSKETGIPFKELAQFANVKSGGLYMSTNIPYSALQQWLDAQVKGNMFVNLPNLYLPNMPTVYHFTLPYNDINTEIVKELPMFLRGMLLPLNMTYTATGTNAVNPNMHQIVCLVPTAFAQSFLNNTATGQNASQNFLKVNINTGGFEVPCYLCTLSAVLTQQVQDNFLQLGSFNTDSENVNLYDHLQTYTVANNFVLASTTNANTGFDGGLSGLTSNNVGWAVNNTKTNGLLTTDGQALFNSNTNQPVITTTPVITNMQTTLPLNLSTMAQWGYFTGFEMAQQAANNAQLLVHSLTQFPAQKAQAINFAKAATYPIVAALLTMADAIPYIGVILDGVAGATIGYMIAEVMRYLGNLAEIPSTNYYWSNVENNTNSKPAQISANAWQTAYQNYKYLLGTQSTSNTLFGKDDTTNTTTQNDIGQVTFNGVGNGMYNNDTNQGSIKSQYDTSWGSKGYTYGNGHDYAVPWDANFTPGPVAVPSSYQKIASILWCGLPQILSAFTVLFAHYMPASGASTYMDFTNPTNVLDPFSASNTASFSMPNFENTLQSAQASSAGNIQNIVNLGNELGDVNPFGSGTGTAPGMLPYYLEEGTQNQDLSGSTYQQYVNSSFTNNFNGTGVNGGFLNGLLYWDAIEWWLEAGWGMIETDGNIVSMFNNNQQMLNNFLSSNSTSNSYNIHSANFNDWAGLSNGNSQLLNLSNENSNTILASLLSNWSSTAFDGGAVAPVNVITGAAYSWRLNFLTNGANNTITLTPLNLCTTSAGLQTYNTSNVADVMNDDTTVLPANGLQNFTQIAFNLPLSNTNNESMTAYTLTPFTNDDSSLYQTWAEDYLNNGTGWTQTNTSSVSSWTVNGINYSINDFLPLSFYDWNVNNWLNTENQTATNSKFTPTITTTKSATFNASINLKENNVVGIVNNNGAWASTNFQNESITNYGNTFNTFASASTTTLIDYFTDLANESGYFANNTQLAKTIPQLQKFFKLKAGMNITNATIDTALKSLATASNNKSTAENTVLFTMSYFLYLNSQINSLEAKFSNTNVQSIISQINVYKNAQTLYTTLANGADKAKQNVFANWLSYLNTSSSCTNQTLTNVEQIFADNNSSTLKALLGAVLGINISTTHLGLSAQFQQYLINETGKTHNSSLNAYFTSKNNEYNIRKFLVAVQSLVNGNACTLTDLQQFSYFKNNIELQITSFIHQSSSEHPILFTFDDINLPDKLTVQDANNLLITYFDDVTGSNQTLQTQTSQTITTFWSNIQQMLTLGMGLCYTQQTAVLTNSAGALVGSMLENVDLHALSNQNQNIYKQYLTNYLQLFPIAEAFSIPNITENNQPTWYNQFTYTGVQNATKQDVENSFNSFFNEYASYLQNARQNKWGPIITEHSLTSSAENWLQKFETTNKESLTTWLSNYWDHLGSKNSGNYGLQITTNNYSCENSIFNRNIFQNNATTYDILSTINNNNIITYTLNTSITPLYNDASAVSGTFSKAQQIVYSLPQILPNSTLQNLFHFNNTNTKTVVDNFAPYITSSVANSNIANNIANPLVLSQDKQTTGVQTITDNGTTAYIDDSDTSALDLGAEENVNYVSMSQTDGNSATPSMQTVSLWANATNQLNGLNLTNVTANNAYSTGENAVADRQTNPVALEDTVTANPYAIFQSLLNAQTVSHGTVASNSNSQVSVPSSATYNSLWPTIDNKNWANDNLSYTFYIPVFFMLGSDNPIIINPVVGGKEGAYYGVNMQRQSLNSATLNISADGNQLQPYYTVQTTQSENVDLITQPENYAIYGYSYNSNTTSSAMNYNANNVYYYNQIAHINTLIGKNPLIFTDYALSAGDIFQNNCFINNYGANTPVNINNIVDYVNNQLTKGLNTTGTVINGNTNVNKSLSASLTNLGYQSNNTSIGSDVGIKNLTFVQQNVNNTNNFLKYSNTGKISYSNPYLNAPQNLKVQVPAINDFNDFSNNNINYQVGALNPITDKSALASTPTNGSYNFQLTDNKFYNTWLLKNINGNQYTMFSNANNFSFGNDLLTNNAVANLANPFAYNPNGSKYSNGVFGENGVYQYALNGLSLQYNGRVNNDGNINWAQYSIQTQINPQDTAVWSLPNNLCYMFPLNNQNTLTLAELPPLFQLQNLTQTLYDINFKNNNTIEINTKAPDLIDIKSLNNDPLAPTLLPNNSINQAIENLYANYWLTNRIFVDQLEINNTSNLESPLPLREKITSQTIYYYNRNDKINLTNIPFNIPTHITKASSLQDILTPKTTATTTSQILSPEAVWKAVLKNKSLLTEQIALQLGVTTGLFVPNVISLKTTTTNILNHNVDYSNAVNNTFLTQNNFLQNDILNTLNGNLYNTNNKMFDSVLMNPFSISTQNKNILNQTLFNDITTAYNSNNILLPNITGNNYFTQNYLAIKVGQQLYNLPQISFATLLGISSLKSFISYANGLLSSTNSKLPYLPLTSQVDTTNKISKTVVQNTVNTLESEAQSLLKSTYGTALQNVNFFSSLSMQMLLNLFATYTYDLSSQYTASQNANDLPKMISAPDTTAIDSPTYKYVTMPSVATLAQSSPIMHMVQTYPLISNYLVQFFDNYDPSILFANGQTPSTINNSNLQTFLENAIAQYMYNVWNNELAFNQIFSWNGAPVNEAYNPQIPAVTFNGSDAALTPLGLSSHFFFSQIANLNATSFLNTNATANNTFLLTYTPQQAQIIRAEQTLDNGQTDPFVKLAYTMMDYPGIVNTGTQQKLAFYASTPTLFEAQNDAFTNIKTNTTVQSLGSTFANYITNGQESQLSFNVGNHTLYFNDALTAYQNDATLDSWLSQRSLITTTLMINQNENTITNLNDFLDYINSLTIPNSDNPKINAARYLFSQFTPAGYLTNYLNPLPIFNMTTLMRKTNNLFTLANVANPANIWNPVVYASSLQTAFGFHYNDLKTQANAKTINYQTQSINGVKYNYPAGTMLILNMFNQNQSIVLLNATTFQNQNDSNESVSAYTIPASQWVDSNLTSLQSKNTSSLQTIFNEATIYSNLVQTIMINNSVYGNANSSHALPAGNGLTTMLSMVPYYALTDLIYNNAINLTSTYDESLQSIISAYASGTNAWTTFENSNTSNTLPLMNAIETLYLNLLLSYGTVAQPNTKNSNQTVQFTNQYDSKVTNSQNSTDNPIIDQITGQSENKNLFAPATNINFTNTGNYLTNELTDIFNGNLAYTLPVAKWMNTGFVYNSALNSSGLTMPTLTNTTVKNFAILNAQSSFSTKNNQSTTFESYSNVPLYSPINWVNMQSSMNLNVLYNSTNQNIKKDTFLQTYAMNWTLNADKTQYILPQTSNNRDGVGAGQNNGEFNSYPTFAPSQNPKLAMNGIQNYQASMLANQAVTTNGNTAEDGVIFNNTSLMHWVGLGDIDDAGYTWNGYGTLYPLQKVANGTYAPFSNQNSTVGSFQQIAMTIANYLAGFKNKNSNAVSPLFDLPNNPSLAISGYWIANPSSVYDQNSPAQNLFETQPSLFKFTATMNNTGKSPLLFNENPTAYTQAGFVLRILFFQDGFTCYLAINNPTTILNYQMIQNGEKTDSIFNYFNNFRQVVASTLAGSTYLQPLTDGAFNTNNLPVNYNNLPTGWAGASINLGSYQYPSYANSTNGENNPLGYMPFFKMGALIKGTSADIMNQITTNFAGKNGFNSSLNTNTTGFSKAPFNVTQFSGNNNYYLITPTSTGSLLNYNLSQMFNVSKTKPNINLIDQWLNLANYTYDTTYSQTGTLDPNTWTIVPSAAKPGLYSILIYVPTTTTATPNAANSLKAIGQVPTGEIIGIIFGLLLLIAVILFGVFGKKLAEKHREKVNARQVQTEDELINSTNAVQTEQDFSPLSTTHVQPQTSKPSSKPTNTDRSSFSDSSAPHGNDTTDDEAM